MSTEEKSYLASWKGRDGGLVTTEPQIGFNAPGLAQFAGKA